MINVRLYQEIVVPYCNLKHGQFAAVALTRSGANKVLKKVWEAFIIQKDRIISREHAKIVQNQRKFDTQFQAAQLSARQQIDKRIDENLAGLDAKVKSIIKETAKSQYIKKESIAFDKSLFEEESAYHGEQSQQAPGFQRQSSSSSSRRYKRASGGSRTS